MPEIHPHRAWLVAHTLPGTVLTGDWEEQMLARDAAVLGLVAEHGGTLRWRLVKNDLFGFENSGDALSAALALVTMVGESRVVLGHGEDRWLAGRARDPEVLAILKLVDALGAGAAIATAGFVRSIPSGPELPFFGAPEDQQVKGFARALTTHRLLGALP